MLKLILIQNIFPCTPRAFICCSAFEAFSRERENRRGRLQTPRPRPPDQPFPTNTEDWQGEIWRDILKLHYGHVAASDIEEKYGNLYTIARLTVSTSNVLKRFKGLNKDQNWPHQIKPFNFFKDEKILPSDSSAYLIIIWLTFK